MPQSHTTYVGGHIGAWQHNWCDLPISNGWLPVRQLLEYLSKTALTLVWPAYPYCSFSQKTLVTHRPSYDLRSRITDMQKLVIPRPSYDLYTTTHITYIQNPTILHVIHWGSDSCSRIKFPHTALMPQSSISDKRLWPKIFSIFPYLFTYNSSRTINCLSYPRTPCHSRLSVQIWNADVQSFGNIPPCYIRMSCWVLHYDTIEQSSELCTSRRAKVADTVTRAERDSLNSCSETGL